MAEEIRSNRQRELFIKKSARVAASYLNRAMSLSEMPDAAKPFFGILENAFVNLWGISSCAEDSAITRKTIGTLCVMVPAELIYAAGAMPVRLCSGSYTAYAIGDDYIPRDACPLVKAVMGFGKIKALPVFDQCSLLVAPVTCDCKKKLSGVIGRGIFAGIIPFGSHTGKRNRQTNHAAVIGRRNPHGRGSAV